MKKFNLENKKIGGKNIMKLWIIAGHGAGDSGAVGNGYKEADVVRQLANRMKALGGSNVEVLDTSRNWYADNGISKLSIPRGEQLIELHLDSATASARGGHVVIQQGLAADKYDTALANYIKSVFAERAEIIKARGDLANPQRALDRNISYRLLEVCFITNTGDISYLMSNMDKVAAGILNAFNIQSGNSTSTPNKTNEQIADEVINGKWGNGEDRKNRLRAAGYDPAVIQALVNKKLS
ncbi:N-acetylmuramoyl-L-alanine amidase [Bacillus cereus]|nr:N-acetylmuramoyl-L-alanine amidase [Bacillus cereus]